MKTCCEYYMNRRLGGPSQAVEQDFLRRLSDYNNNENSTLS
jgi:hypothetical protein